METTIYFKDIRNKDYNNYPNRIYKVENSRMLIEILDNNHIHGKPYYFTSLQSRDNFILEIKEHISKNNNEELEKIQNYWKQKLD